MMLPGVGLVFLSKKAPAALYALLLSIEIIAIAPFLMIYGGGV